MKTSAGILLYRRGPRGLEVLIAHPGGPYFRRRHEGAWTIPKGGVEDGESLEEAARREFEEETGHRPEGDLRPLGSIRQRAGKVVHAWACEGDWDPSLLESVSFEMEWPPRSGRQQVFPEIDAARFVGIDEARRLMNQAQSEFIDRLLRALGDEEGRAEPASA